MTRGHFPNSAFLYLSSCDEDISIVVLEEDHVTEHLDAPFLISL
jgi:hypothetical protein